MEHVEAPNLTVVRPGEGETRNLGTIGVAFKLFGAQTNGNVSIVEHPFPVGACVPPHMHTREDEYSIVTQGEIGFRSGDREVVLGAGGYITKPGGDPHDVERRTGSGADDRGDQPCGLRALLLGVGEVMASGAPDRDAIAALAEEYGARLRRRAVARRRRRALPPRRRRAGRRDSRSRFGGGTLTPGTPQALFCPNAFRADTPGPTVGA